MDANSQISRDPAIGMHQHPAIEANSTRIMFERLDQQSREEKMDENNSSPWEIFCKWLADRKSPITISELQDLRGAKFPFKFPTTLVYDPKKQSRALYGVGGWTAALFWLNPKTALLRATHFLRKVSPNHIDMPYFWIIYLFVIQSSTILNMFIFISKCYPRNLCTSFWRNHHNNTNGTISHFISFVKMF